VLAVMEGSMGGNQASIKKQPPAAEHRFLVVVSPPMPEANIKGAPSTLLSTRSTHAARMHTHSRTHALTHSRTHARALQATVRSGVASPSCWARACRPGGAGRDFNCTWTIVRSSFRSSEWMCGHVFFICVGFGLLLAPTLHARTRAQAHAHALPPAPPPLPPPPTPCSVLNAAIEAVLATHQAASLHIAAGLLPSSCTYLFRLRATNWCVLGRGGHNHRYCPRYCHRHCHCHSITLNNP
jgi:hypothetical protein